MNDRRRNTVRIDYDKLAEAIVKAQSNANKDDIKKAIIEANQEIENAKPTFKYSKELLKFVISPMLIIFSVFGVLFAFGVIMYTFQNWNSFIFTELSGYYQIVSLFGIFVFSVLFSVFSFLSFKELDKSEDTNYVFSMFSNIVAFVALIVAAIALIK